MNNCAKIIIATLIAIVAVSLLFLVVPITATFVISYIFTLLGICGISASLYMFGKRSNKAPQGFAYTVSATTYLGLSILFSVIACLVELSVQWTIVIHVGILAVFLIRAIAVSSGNTYIQKTDDIGNAKSEAFQKEKQNYWK